MSETGPSPRSATSPAAPLLEQALALRGEGYMLDFWGPGFDASERIGLLPLLRAIHYPISELVFVDARGRRRFALRYETLRHRLFRDRHFNFPRGDLERILYREVKDAVDIRFGTTAQHLVQNKQGIELRLTDGSFERADLVVGADGVRSLVRALVFGPAERFLQSLGHVAAAWILTHVPDQVDAN